MEQKKELFRLVSLTVLFGLVLAVFFFLLYDLQVVHKITYQEKTVKSIATTETVPAARGEITDRYGRTLVSNQVVYQVTLDGSAMGERKNHILLGLITAAREQGVTWSDSLPISKRVPFRFERSGRANYDKLAQLQGWDATTGSDALAQIRQTYNIDETLSDEDARLLAGLLYELDIRLKEITWSEYIFARGVDINFISAVRERGLTGVNVAPVTVRKYATTYAAHILGRTGSIQREDWPTYKELGYAMNETVGTDGAERAFESLLRGTAGTKVVERNTDGKTVNETWQEEPAPGYNLALTLDLPLQQKVEDILARDLPTLTEDTQGGAAVMIDVHSGGVLAMASYPTYDLTTIYQNAELYNEVLSDPLKPFTNRATSGLYSPGSTFKPMVAAAALEEGIITPSTKIKDTGRYTYYGTANAPACWIFRQYGGTHGVIDVSRAIEVSCNVFFYDVGRRLGIDLIDAYAARFGLGEPTGIEIPEQVGVVAGPAYTESRGQTWYVGSTLSAAIGQENNQFTPLQLANYTATLANGGTHYRAHLLKSVKSADYTQTVDTCEPEVLNTIHISDQTFAAIKKGMLALTTTGSLGSYFRGLDFQVCAKTGSAQVAGSTSNATFICFAPADDPQVALAIVAEQGGSGSSLAGLAAEMLSFYFNNTQNGLPVTVEENTLLR